MSPQTLAWNVIREFGTDREIEIGAHYSAYGRHASIIALGATVSARIAPVLTLVA
jgi:hypothetical protein